MRSFLTGLLCGAACVMNVAQADTRVITFSEAIKIALSQNIDLRLADNSAENNEVSVRDARNQFLPDLSLTGSAIKYYGRFFSQIDGRIIDQATQLVNVGASSGLTLFSGFHDVAGLRSAKFSSSAGHLDFERTKETVAITVLSNFLGLIQDREQLAVLQEYLAAQSKLREQIAIYVEGGSKTTGDLYTQEATVASAQLSVMTAKRSSQVAALELAQTLQLEPGGTYEFRAPEESFIDAAPPAPLENLLSSSLERRKDISAERARVKAAQQNVRVAQSSYWPAVSLSATYGSGYTSATPLPTSQQLDLNRAGSVGVNVTIPIFDRGAARSATLRAELQLQREQINLEALEETAGLEVRRAYLEFQTATEQLSAARAQERAAEKAVEFLQRRYEMGAATLVELAQGNATYLQAKSEVVSAHDNVLLQRMLIDYQSGELVLDPKQG
jgi:outer membrane protein